MTNKVESPAQQQFKSWTAEDYRRSADVHEVAERIIRRVVANVLSLAHVRHNLDELTDGQAFVDDGLAVALGEDTGCLDPDNLSAENCEVLFVEKELYEILNRALSTSSQTPPTPLSEELEQNLMMVAKELNGGEFHGTITHVILPIVLRIAHKFAAAQTPPSETAQDEWVEVAAKKIVERIEYWRGSTHLDAIGDTVKIIRAALRSSEPSETARLDLLIRERDGLQINQDSLIKQCEQKDEVIKRLDAKLAALRSSGMGTPPAHSLDKDHWINCKVCGKRCFESCINCETCLDHCSETQSVQSTG